MTLQCHSPIDGRVYIERPLASESEIAAALAAARCAQREWRAVSIGDRVSLCLEAMTRMQGRRDELGEELAWQMGRPIRYGPKEIDTMATRARYMGGAAEHALADVVPEQAEGLRTFISKEPLGVVFAIAPWNYPYLTAVSTVVPALMAGNAVILKHSPQTPLCAERLAESFAEAGLPKGAFQFLHLGIEDTHRVVSSPEVAFVAFTGSVAVGRAIQKTAADRVIGVGLELGGKDPAYVRRDADLTHAVENLVDGAFFNSGQSCCAIERIYVHADVYSEFVEGAVELTRKYVLGNPLETDTTMGPMVRTAAADFVRGQIHDAVARGARTLIHESIFPASRPGSPYLAPQILVDVDHSMGVMRDESFGPVVGIMKVGSDDEAIELMNDSPFGLTAAVWTSDSEAALRISRQIETGTCFMNRCDFLDPALAWTGVKDSGRGCTLSTLGFDHLTRPKSFHLRLTT